MSDQEKKSLAIQLKGEGPHNLSAYLESSLSPSKWNLLKLIAQASEDEQAAFYIVGGLVRDLFLGRAGFDFDLVLEGKAISFAQKLSKKYAGELSIHQKFGTAKWTIKDGNGSLAKELQLENDELPISLDFVTARKEEYPYPGSLPVVEASNIREDCHRRDFTINTLALRLDGDNFGELVDFWGGVKDIQAAVLRVLHEQSFSDDATRILRILRFQGRFGYSLEANTQKWMLDSLPHLQAVSGTRIRNEMYLLFQEAERISVLNKMQDLGVLSAIHPALTFGKEMAEAIKNQDRKKTGAKWEIGNVSSGKIGMLLWLMHQKREDIASICNRLSLDKQMFEAIKQANHARSELDRIANMSPSKATFILEKISPLARYALFVDSNNEKGKKVLEKYALEWRNVRPKINGISLKEKGLQEGPRFAEILTTLRAAWLDGSINSIKEENEMLEGMLNDFS